MLRNFTQQAADNVQTRFTAVGQKPTSEVTTRKSQAEKPESRLKVNQRSRSREVPELAVRQPLDAPVPPTASVVFTPYYPPLTLFVLLRIGGDDLFLRGGNLLRGDVDTCLARFPSRASPFDGICARLPHDSPTPLYGLYHCGRCGDRSSSV